MIGYFKAAAIKTIKSGISMPRTALIRFIFLTLTWLNLSSFTFAQETGRVGGIIIDSETGEPVIGANVYLENTYLGAATDLDGSYMIPGIPFGNYTLIVSSVGYADARVTEIAVSNTELVRIDLVLTTELLSTEVIEIEARALRNNDASLLRDRQKSVSISDAVSAEAISRSGSTDAADAMTQVTGASVVAGKYVYIRGLGDRYSTTTLNGSELVTADPDRKAVQMDLFPANLLDNITTIKTFTPDKPGNFSGGMVDINTKNYPDNLTVKFKAGVAYNSLTTNNRNFLTYPGGDKDWLGYDDGIRDIPVYIQENPQPPTEIQARFDSELADQLDNSSKSFAPHMGPVQKTGPVNQSYLLSVGDQVSLFGRPFGYIASWQYGRNYNFYESGRVGRWDLTGSVTSTDTLSEELNLNDARGTDEVNWGAIVTLASKFHEYHDIAFNYFYTQSGAATARFLDGRWTKQLGPEPLYETRTLKYVERNLKSYQLSGEHHVPALLNSRIEWRGAITNTTQDEPDLRYFTDLLYGENNYTVFSSGVDVPSRYYRTMTEDGKNIKFDWGIPFRQWSGLEARVKLGGSFNEKNRNFEESFYNYRQNPSSPVIYTGDPNEFFSRQNVGLVDSTVSGSRTRYIFGPYITLGISDAGNYQGLEKIVAGYMMVELPIYYGLKFIGGVRLEKTKMEVEAKEKLTGRSEIFSQIIQDNWLPSINLVYLLGENMNLRASYGKTLARPTVREMSPYSAYDFSGDYTYIGNPNLKITQIDNLDLRWEWFMSPGEIAAISGFYKKMVNPLELNATGNIDFPSLSYVNVDKGILWGVEFEFRKALGIIDQSLKNFKVGVNLTLVHSEVDIPQPKYVQMRLADPGGVYFTESTRPLQGQSPYVVNADLGYDNLPSGTSINLFYNIYGKRLAEIVLTATPDAYEKPLQTLDLIVMQRIWNGFNIKLSAKNLLANPVQFVHEYKGREYIRKSYNTARIYTLNLEYNL